MRPIFRVLPLLALSLALLPSAAAPRPVLAAPRALAPTNYADGEIVRHPVVLLRGEAPPEAAALEATNMSSSRPTRTLAGVVRAGRFLALAELVPGENRLLLRAGATEGRLRLIHRPATTGHVVRCIYLTDSSGDTRYQTPRDDEAQDAPGRLDTAMKLLQCFTAERMHDLGFGRATFRLELDANGRVDVHVLRGEHPAAEEYALDDQAWWRRIAELVARRLPAPHVKNVVVAAYTRFDRTTRRVHGHTALGGGDLGLFGSAGLFAWPRALGDVFQTFADTTPVDGTLVHDDSAGRSTVWGLASTTLGAVLHEMGHAFGLPHSTDPLDVMTRGFDRFNRVFSLVEPPPRSGGPPREFRLEDAAAFAPVSAAALRASPWFQPDAPAPPGEPPTVTFDDDGGARLVAPTGARYVGLLRRGDAVGFRSYWAGGGTPPRAITLRPEDLALEGGAVDAVRVIDDRGTVVTERVVVTGRFVTSWHFAPTTRPWPDAGRFVPLGPRDLDRIAAEAGRAARADAPSGYVDFVPRFGAGPDVAAYATRSLQLPTPLRVRLLTGSDDALRVFLDGKPVVERLLLRGATPDEDATDLELPAGRHLLLVEVSQRGGGWGLYLRFEDARGAPLRLTDRGELVPTR